MEKIDKKRKIEQTENFKISRMKELIKPTKPHKHDGYHEFIILYDGAGVHTIDEVDYEVNPPTLFYLQGGQVHCWDFTQIPKGYVMIFKEEFLDEFNDIRQLLSNIPTQLKLKKDNKQLLVDFDMMMNEFASEDTNELILKNYLNIIIYKLNDLINTSQQSSNTENILISQFKKLVNKYYKTHRDISFYAEHLNVTNRKLSSLCSADLGRPASSIITERLVMESKRLLRYTNNSISEIAFELHYTDPSHFVKFFRTKTNLTPLEFRKQF